MLSTSRRAWQRKRQRRRSREQVELLGRVSLLGEMTASLAHELNQPLAAIVNNATAAMQYLEQGRLNPEQLQEILNDVVADGRRAYDVMHNVRSAIKKGSAIRGRDKFERRGESRRAYGSAGRRRAVLQDRNIALHQICRPLKVIPPRFSRC